MRGQTNERDSLHPPFRKNVVPILYSWSCVANIKLRYVVSLKVMMSSLSDLETSFYEFQHDFDAYRYHTQPYPFRVLLHQSRPEDKIFQLTLRTVEIFKLTLIIIRLQYHLLTIPTLASHIKICRCQVRTHHHNLLIQ